MAGVLPQVSATKLAPLPETPQQLTGFNTTQQAMETIVYQMGIPLPTKESFRPGFNGELPPSLTDLNDEQLGDLLNDFSKYAEYVGFCVARADGERADAEAAMNFLMARIRLSLREGPDGKKLAQKDKDDMVIADERVKVAMERFRYCDAVYSITKKVADNAKLAWETVSRRITQRGQEVERMRREHTVGSVPMDPARSFRRPSNFTP